MSEITLWILCKQKSESLFKIQNKFENNAFIAKVHDASLNVLYD